METRYYENGDITTKVEYKWVGYGLDAQSVYCKFITTFSIAKGVIKNREYVRANCFYRNQKIIVDNNINMVYHVVSGTP